MKTTIPLVALIALTGSALAGERVVTASKTRVPVETECFRAKELQLDIFGQYSVGEGPDHAGTFRDHGWGGGVGMNYFVTRNFGLGVDAAWLSAKEANYTARTPAAAVGAPGVQGVQGVQGAIGGAPGAAAATARRNSDPTTVHNFSASLIYRFPIDSICTAPYVFAGGGFAVDGKQWATAHAGAGVEKRLSSKVGLFTDARWTFLGDRFGRGDLGNLGVRAGVRIVF